MIKGNSKEPRPEGHVLVPATLFGSLSILLVVGLKVLGVLNRLDLIIAKTVAQSDLQDFPKSVPPALLWLTAIGLAFGIAHAILHITGFWRRMMLWLTALVLIAAWAPVLSLAAHSPNVAGPWIATLWSGFCALVYARNHRMPCDRLHDAPPSGHK